MLLRRLLLVLFVSSSAFAQVLSSIAISPTNLGPGETATAKVTLSEPGAFSIVAAPASAQ